METETTEHNAAFKAKVTLEALKGEDAEIKSESEKKDADK